MLDYRLNKQELAELRAAHRRALNVREAYRINAVISLGNGPTVADLADALLFDPDTVRAYFKRYKKGGVEALLRMNYVGSEALLDDIQLAVLDAHPQKHLHLTAESVARWVEERWGVCYAPSEANHNLSLWLDEPGGTARKLYRSKYLFTGGCPGNGCGGHR